MMRLADQLGAVEQGKIADLIVMPRNPLDGIAAVKIGITGHQGWQGGAGR